MLVRLTGESVAQTFVHVGAVDRNELADQAD